MELTAFFPSFFFLLRQLPPFPFLVVVVACLFLPFSHCSSGIFAFFFYFFSFSVFLLYFQWRWPGAWMVRVFVTTGLVLLLSLTESIQLLFFFFLFLPFQRVTLAWPDGIVSFHSWLPFPPFFLLFARFWCRYGFVFERAWTSAVASAFIEVSSASVLFFKVVFNECLCECDGARIDACALDLFFSQRRSMLLQQRRQRPLTREQRLRCVFV